MNEKMEKMFKKGFVCYQVNKDYEVEKDLFQEFQNKVCILQCSIFYSFQHLGRSIKLISFFFFFFEGGLCMRQ